MSTILPMGSCVIRHLPLTRWHRDDGEVLGYHHVVVMCRRLMQKYVAIGVPGGEMSQDEPSCSGLIGQATRLRSGHVMIGSGQFGVAFEIRRFADDEVCTVSQRQRSLTGTGVHDERHRLTRPPFRYGIEVHPTSTGLDHPIGHQPAYIGTSNTGGGQLGLVEADTIGFVEPISDGGDTVVQNLGPKLERGADRSDHLSARDGNRDRSARVVEDGRGAKSVEIGLAVGGEVNR